MIEQGRVPCATATSEHEIARVRTILNEKAEAK